MHMIRVLLPFILLLSACSTQPQRVMESSTAQPPALKLPIEIAKPVPLTDETIDDFLMYAALSPLSEREQVRAAIAERIGDEKISTLIQERYKKIINDDFDFALLTLSVLGEVRANNSIPFFAEILETQLDKNKPDLEHGLSRRDSINLLQAKAVEGLAYLKNSEANDIVIKTAANHPSRAVRSAAVQAMLYNAKDKKEARKKLEEVLRKEDLLLLDLVRRSSTSKIGEFNKQLAEFYNKYPEEVAKPPGKPTENTDVDYKDESNHKDEAVTPRPDNVR